MRNRSPTTADLLADSKDRNPMPRSDRGVVSGDGKSWPL